MLWDYNYMPSEDKYSVAKDLSITPDRLETIIRTFAKHDYRILSSWRRDDVKQFLRTAFKGCEDELIDMVYVIAVKEVKP